METYLAHHGILGMKWGVRRYQNPDGTLTERGKKHVRSVAAIHTKLGKGATRAGNAVRRYEENRSSKEKQKIVSDMKFKTDDELAADNKRAKLESTYLKNHGAQLNDDKQPEVSVVGGALKALADASGITAAKYEKIATAETAKKAKNMTDAELRAAINRMQLEDQYRNLAKKDRESGANYVYSFKRETINDIVTYSTAAATVIAPILLKKFA